MPRSDQPTRSTAIEPPVASERPVAAAPPSLDRTSAESLTCPPARSDSPPHTPCLKRSSNSVSGFSRSRHRRTLRRLSNPPYMVNDSDGRTCALRYVLVGWTARSPAAVFHPRL